MANPLAQWLNATSTTQEAFAARAGRDRSTISRWASRGPQTLEAAAIIERATGGAVAVVAWAPRSPAPSLPQNTPTPEA